MEKLPSPPRPCNLSADDIAKELALGIVLKYDKQVELQLNGDEPARVLIDAEHLYPLKDVDYRDVFWERVAAIILDNPTITPASVQMFGRAFVVLALCTRYARAGWAVQRGAWPERCAWVKHPAFHSSGEL